MGSCCCSSKHAVAPQPYYTRALCGVTQSGDEDIRDKYDIGTLLGSGSFGQVREAATKEPPYSVRAVKMIERDDRDGEWSNQAIFVREVGLLQNLQHENIIQYFDVYEDHHFLYVVMELCRGGEVFSKIIELKRFSERHAAMLGEQMLKAIDYIHTIRIVHRDVKAENFMLAEPSWPSTVKMIDFGMACKLEPGQVLTELCGSPHYLAPELIGQRYNHLVDVWSFGVLLYLLMYGLYPYDGKRSRDIMVKILAQPIKWQTTVHLSHDAMDFLKRVLEHSPTKRMSAAEALQHPWMASKGGTDQAEASFPSEVVRSAHKKVTATRKQVDPKIEQVRNQKLKEIEQDFRRGIRNSHRLRPTECEEFMTKPEFVRRENKIATSPAEPVFERRRSLEHLIGRVRLCTSPRNQPQSSDEGCASQTLSHASDNTADTPRADTPRSTKEQSWKSLALQRRGKTQRRDRRCWSVSSPRRAALERDLPYGRLSYIGSLTNKEEQNLASLYTEKESAEAASTTTAKKAPQKKYSQAPNFHSIAPSECK